MQKLRITVMALEMRELLNTIPQVGLVDWIGLRPGRRQAIHSVDHVHATLTGLDGDRFVGQPNAKRMVTLIQREHLQVVAEILKTESIDPALLRRNIVAAGINLQSLKNRRFQIGQAILFGTGNCPPCSRMEENLGAGGYNAMRGHGGITATVIQPGRIAVGNAVCFFPTEQSDEN